MGYFKKFTDFCAGFAAFSALMYLFREFMAYTPKGEEPVGLREKLDRFLSAEPIRDYDFYLPLIALLLLSLILSLLLKKRPYLSFAVSLLPLSYTLLLFTEGHLYERPMLYVILSALHTAGSLIACILEDREDRGRRGALALDLGCLVTAGLCARVLLWSPDQIGEETERIPLFDQILLQASEGADRSVFLAVAIILTASVLLRLLWRDLYFLDAALAILPTAWVLLRFFGGEIPFFGALLSALCALCAIGRITVMLCCKPRQPIPKSNPS